MGRVEMYRRIRPLHFAAKSGSIFCDLAGLTGAPNRSWRDLYACFPKDTLSKITTRDLDRRARRDGCLGSRWDGIRVGRSGPVLLGQQLRQLLFAGADELQVEVLLFLGWRVRCATGSRPRRHSGFRRRFNVNAWFNREPRSRGRVGFEANPLQAVITPRL